jgi:Raf kinase inhibitor-like YbhB/YbcL family protein
MAMAMSSGAFQNGGTIPSTYTCDGKNVSPALKWGQPPSGTQSMALVMDDPDAPSGTFVHWVYYDLPSDLTSLPEDVPTDDRPSAGGVQGQNGAGKIGYTGPCPPSGMHHYYFHVYALDAKLNAAPGLTQDQLVQQMQGHIIAEGELMCTYRRGG